VNVIFSKIVAFKGTIGKFLNVAAAQTGGLRYPPICLFETLFWCQCPFNTNSKLADFYFKLKLEYKNFLGGNNKKPVFFYMLPFKLLIFNIMWFKKNVTETSPMPAVQN
jgi:hypothetical protein